MSDGYLNVVDVEATTDGGADDKEIIQVGVCVLDLETGERVLKRSVYVRPRIARVSEFCTELTGITQEQADAGTDFADACTWLREALDSETRPWASWGEYDRKQFARECRLKGVEYPFGDIHVNAKELHARARGRKSGVGMDRALALEGLPLEGRHHDGGDDAWNIAALAARSGIAEAVAAAARAAAKQRAREQRRAEQQQQQQQQRE